MRRSYINKNYWQLSKNTNSQDMMRTSQYILNQNIFENVRIKPDVIVRCRRSGVYIIHILSSTPQLHWKSRKYILSQRILNDASCCHDDQISLSHLGAYCIVVAYSKLYDHHQINNNFVYRCYEFYASPCNKIL